MRREFRRDYDAFFDGGFRSVRSASLIPGSYLAFGFVLEA